MIIVNEQGAYINRDGIYVPAGSSDILPSLALTLQARILAYDPQGVGVIIYSADPPVGLSEGSVYTSGDGLYYKQSDGAWVELSVELPDTFYVTGPTAYGAAVRALLFIKNGASPENWVTSFNAGAQNVSFASYADYKAWLDDRILYLQKLANRNSRTTGFMFRYHYPEGVVA